MYQAIVYILQPLTVVLLLQGCAILILWRRSNGRRRDLILLTATYVLLVLCCMPVAAYYALGSLEWQYPSASELPNERQSTVVLGGYIKEPSDVGNQGCPRRVSTSHISIQLVDSSLPA